MSGLRLTRVPSRPPRELESAGAAAAGCSRQYADMVSVTAADGAAAGGAAQRPPRDLPVAGAVRLCVYDVPVAERGV